MESGYVFGNHEIRWNWICNEHTHKYEDWLLYENFQNFKIQELEFDENIPPDY